MTLDESLAITGNLGTASKLPCHTWSISAKKCKRGNKLRKIKGSVCSLCYAARGRFNYPTVKTKIAKNLVSINNPKWVEAMAIVINAFENSGYFRFFSSGDIQSLGMLIKICAVCRLTPHIKYWLPTHEVGIIGAFKRAGFGFPENLTVRLSADMLEDVPSESLMTSLGVLGGGVSKTNYNCVAPKQDNMCQKCRLCWNKDVKVIVYKQH